MLSKGRDGIEWFDPKAIKIVQEGGTKTKGVLFKNPRTYTNPGFSPEKMAELRRAIAKDGLKQPLEVRLVNNRVELVAGERRLRSILELLRTKTPCYNRNTKQMEPADKVYTEVCCVVIDANDDKDAIRQAVLENLLHEHLTDYELLLQCKRMEEAGFTRSEQAETFGKSEAWISQSHSLLNTNKRVLDCMEKGTLGRTQALRFLQISADKIDEVLDGALKENVYQLEVREQTALNEQDKAFETIEEAEAEIVAAQMKGRTTEAGEAKRKLQQAEKDASAAAKKVANVRKQKGKRRVSVEDIDTAAKNAGADENLNHSQSMKVVRQVNHDLEVELGKGSALINPDTDEEYDRREVCIIKRTLDWVLNKGGMKHPLEALAEPPEE